MRRALALLLALVALLACGGDRMERGLSPPDEEAVPMDAGELQESEAERRQREADEESEASDSRFEQAQQGSRDGS